MHFVYLYVGNIRLINIRKANQINSGVNFYEIQIILLSYYNLLWSVKRFQGLLTLIIIKCFMYYYLILIILFNITHLFAYR